MWLPTYTLGSTYSVKLCCRTAIQLFDRTLSDQIDGEDAMVKIQASEYPTEQGRVTCHKSVENFVHRQSFRVTYYMSKDYYALKIHMLEKPLIVCNTH